MAKSFFKPRHNDNNFVLAVGMTAAKMLLFVVLLLMVSGGGLLLGVAKAWIETAPELDLSHGIFRHGKPHQRDAG